MLTAFVIHVAGCVDVHVSRVVVIYQHRNTCHICPSLLTHVTCLCVNTRVTLCLPVACVMYASVYTSHM